jgi:hypothetical protein
MKAIASTLLAFGLLAGTIAEADAAACARGVYHSGCVGPRGAVTTTHRAYAPPAAGVRCYYRAGVRVCR